MFSAVRNKLTFFFLLLTISANSFRSFCANNEQKNTDTLQRAEKVYLHIDRNSYSSGDDIWFKAYVIDPSTNMLSRNTNNLHVELISQGNEIISERILRIHAGTGHGDFSLGDSLQSGGYFIRAYTNHMRNYDESFFFKKEINVINPFEDLQGNKPEIKRIENRIDVSFFPEGGSLIENVSSTIAFKAVNALGKGCDVTVELYSDPGGLITIFNSTHLGMGFFNLKPLPGYSYYTKVKAKDGTETKVSLPGNFPAGLAIRAVVTPEKELILTINTNEATLESVKGKEFSVNLSSRNLVNETTKVKIDSLVNNYRIPFGNIPDGVVRITLSEFAGLPLCERLVFVQRNENARLMVHTDKKEYSLREKVNLSLEITGDTAIKKTGNFSVSAAEARLTDTAYVYPRSIASWFLLESDVKGEVEDPSYYFDQDNKKRLQDLDILLMTQGWRDFRWKYDTVTFFRHEIGFSVSGTVKRIVNNKPITGIKINLGLFSQGITEFMDTKTDRNGQFRFEELNIYGRTGMFVSSTDRFDNMQGKIFVDRAKYEPPKIEIENQEEYELRLNTKETARYKQETVIKMNELKKYKLSDTIKVGEVTITATKEETPQDVRIRESRKFYTAPDKEHIVPKAAESYVGDVFSYIVGRIPGVTVVRGQNEKSIYFPDDVQVYIRNQYSISDFLLTGVKRGALILLDGYEIDEGALGYVLSLPMNIIDRIDVLDASPLYGMRGANGVINIITKTGITRDPFKLPPNSVYNSIQGFNIPRIFYFPKYDNKDEKSNTPDYRSTVFWEPDIKIEKEPLVKLKYFNADSPTAIKVVAEGVTKDGVPLCGRTSYLVK